MSSDPRTVLRAYFGGLPSDFLLDMEQLGPTRWTPGSYDGCLRARVTFQHNRKKTPAEILAEASPHLGRTNPFDDKGQIREFSCPTTHFSSYQDIVDHENRILAEHGLDVPTAFDRFYGQFEKYSSDIPQSRIAFGEAIREIIREELRSRQVVFNAEGGDVPEPTIIDVPPEATTELGRITVGGEDNA